MNFSLELGPLDRAYMEKIRSWRNDYAIWRWTRQCDFISDVAQEAWFERQAKDPSVKMYIIKTNFEGETKPVGVCGLTSIDQLNRRAEFSLYIAPAFQKRGLGERALRILIQHAFTNLNLRQVWGETFDGNPAAKMFERIGFKKDGTRRKFYFKDGKMHDAHLYSILAEEWADGLSLGGGTGAEQSPAPSASSGAAETGSPEPRVTYAEPQSIQEFQKAQDQSPERRRRVGARAKGSPGETVA